MPGMQVTRVSGAATALLVVAGLLASPGPGNSAAGVIAVTSPPPPVAFRSALASLLAAYETEAAPSPAPAETTSAATTQATTTPAASPKLPACGYRDILTRFHAVKHWRKTLLDTNLRLKRTYAPWDLVSVSKAGIAGSGRVRRIIIPDLAALASAARRAGKPLAVRSAYRSYQTQVATFRSWVERSGYAQALKFSARPGHSEHQLGTTVDFTTAPGVPLSTSFGSSPAGKWLARNSWRYGFVMSYPKGQRRVSCYGYEPWHFRYVGRELAQRIHESGEVPRRYLWRHFETAP
jgi:D-alanyl-D-alanine carboxypeptidase